jgi:hypothetical protein
MIAQVHAGEYVLNAAQVAGRAPLPPQFQQPGGLVALSAGPQPSSISLPGVAGGTDATALSRVTNQNTGMVGDLHVHMYDTRSPRENVRQIASYVKTATRRGSPANS